MNKKISLMLAGILTAGALAGCSSSGGSGDGGKPQQGNAAPAAPDAKPPTKFSISYPSTQATGYHTRIPDLNKDKWVLSLGKLTNTELNVRVTDTSKMPVMFASNDIPDVVCSLGTPSDKAMAGSVEAGVFLSLDDLLKQNAPNLMKLVPKQAWDAVSVNGKIYGMPNWLENPSRRATFIRTDLLEKAGLQPPKTIDEFLNVLRAFKKMGVEHPYMGRDSFKYADLVLGSFDVLPFNSQFEVVNGQVQPKFFDVENTEKALAVLKTMFDEGLIAKEFATISSTDWLKNIRAGKAGMWSANLISMVDFRTNIPNVVPTAKIDVIPSPQGPEGKSGYFLYAPVTDACYINKNVKLETAAEIVKFFDWFPTKEAEMWSTFGIEGDTYTKDSSGKINYKIPTTQEGIEEENWRGTIRNSHESTVNRLKMANDPNGPDILKAFDTVLSKEGLGGIRFMPELQAFGKYPDLSATADDVGPKLIVDHMIKMVYGKEPITDWPKVIEEYKVKGGNDIIKEANDRYSKKQGILDQTRK